MEKTHLKNWIVPFFDVTFDSKEKKAASKVIKSGWSADRTIGLFASSPFITVHRQGISSDAQAEQSQILSHAR